LLKTDNPLLKRAGQLCCVSVAAQVGTFPLSIYYFHQFPVYFWLSNFVVVPAAYLILGFTGIYFLLSPFGQMTRFIARLLCGTADLTLWLLKKIGKFPFSVIDGLSISFVQFACLLICLGLFMFFIVHKRHEFFFSGLSFLLLFQISGLAQKINLFSQRKLIIYQSAEQVIHLINGRTNYLITNSKNAPDPYLYKNVLLNLRLDPPFIIQTELPGEENFYDLLIHLPVIQFTDKSLILQDGNQYQDLPENTNSFRHGLLDLNRTGRNTIRLDLD
jgi:competence protein ComEC